MARRFVLVLSALALVLTAVGPVGAKSPTGTDRGHSSDNISTPLSERQAQLKQRAQELLLSGKATAKGKNKVVKVAKGQFVELAFEGEDQILTLLGEFGTGQDNTHDGRRSHAPHGGTDGPLHNQIPEPDRDLDNTTIWTEDFNPAHYDELLHSKGTFPSMANFYLEQSSGTYSVDGYVGDWVQVPDNAATYGSNYCGSIVCQDTWFFVEDQVNLWWEDLVAEQGSVDAANAFLETFDVWDRYDHDGDGNFNEPDGYIDHFQSVHAGEGEETGGGAQGSDAIWSHRWYVQLTCIGCGGPTVGGDVVPFGGVQIGDSNFWVGDYTIEPENGGVGVFAHEFAHDLGLPDHYDLSGNTGGAENSTAWWTIMSQGSYGTQNGIDLGSAPTHFSAWDKWQLGFIRNWAVATNESSGTFTLGPAEYNTKKPQVMFILLPEKEVPLNLGAPYEGEQYYYSGAGNDLDNSMTKSVTLPASGDLELNAQVRYDIETDWDYAYLTVNGVSVATNRSTNANPNGQNFGNGITGNSGPNWVALTADLSAFAGQSVDIGFRYWTDGFVVEPGFQVDALEIPGQAFDGAEADAGWTFDGFRTTSGSETEFFFNAYVLENRQYLGYDKALQTGPYNFTTDTYVEHFPYQDGLLISYWDESVHDNNVGDHPGSGWILPVDSHPAIETWADGSQMRPRIQSYDSTFTTTKTDAITLHNPADGVAKTIASKPATSVFNDSLRDGDGTSIYWMPGHPSDAPGNTRYQAEWNSVDVPNTGTVVRVKSISNTGILTLDLNK